MALLLRYMRVSDIQDVLAIERQSFSTPWPARSYAYEIGESRHSFMVVLQRVNAPESRSVSRLLKGIMGTPGEMTLGYGGLWKIMEEAHISTIASHPSERGSGYGEVLLAAMLRKSIQLSAQYVVLEVRLSNTVAQGLYKKYGFEVYGVKSGYYRDNGEDAYDMRLDISRPAVRAHVQQNWDAVRERIKFTDDYTDTPHPRLKV